MAISVVILAVEVGGGLASGSLALLSDAGHVFIDMLAVTSAIAVERAVLRGRSERRYRSIGGYVNAALLFAVAVAIVIELIARFDRPYEVKGTMVIFVAAFGAVGNWIQHRILESSAAANVTHRGMERHVLSDLWQSLLVVASGTLIAVTGIAIFDLVASLLLAVVFTFWSFRLLADSIAAAAGRGET